MTYALDWDRPHLPDDNPLWQESDCYWFFDRKTGIGGYHRIGQTPNQHRGNVMLNVFKLGGARFRSLAEYSEADCMRDETSQQVGSSSAKSIDDMEMRFSWDEPGCAAELTFYESFYEPRDWVSPSQKSDGAAAVEKEMNTGGHLECSGRLRGVITIDGVSVEVDALAHRDRSWGIRDLRMAYQHRMVTGTVGPDLSWATFVMRLENGVAAHAGFVVRHGEAVDIERLETVTGFADDGLTVIDLRARLHLVGGEHVDLSGHAAEGFCAVTDGWLLSSHHYIEIGEMGFSVLDTTNRPSKGDYVPTPDEVLAVCIEDGLTPCGPYGE